MQLRRCAQDDRIDSGQRQRFSEAGGDMADPVLGGYRARGLELTADQRYDFDAADHLDRIEMLLAKGAGAGKDNFQGRFSRMRWPTAVFEAGTW
jgi:hypothetical protein